MLFLDEALSLVFQFFLTWASVASPYVELLYRARFARPGGGNLATFAILWNGGEWGEPRYICHFVERRGIGGTSLHLPFRGTEGDWGNL